MSDSTRDDASGKPCSECGGTGEYRYLADPTGKNPPLSSRNDTGWRDGYWHKACWVCHGSRRRV